MNYTIEINEQQIDFLVKQLEFIITDEDTDGLTYSQTSKAIAEQIINKLLEAQK